MSHNEEFDELARRKLEQRPVAFQEADWQAARKLIDAERGGRNRIAWITGTIVLLLISGLVWYGTSSTGTEENVASIEQFAPRTVEATAADQPVENTSATATDAPLKANESAAEPTATAAPAAASDVQVPSIQSIPVHSVDRGTEATTKAKIPTKKGTPRKSVETNTVIDDQPEATPSQKNATATEQAASSKEETKEVSGPKEVTVTTTAVLTVAAVLSEPIKASDLVGTIVSEGKATPHITTRSNTTSPTATDQTKEPTVQPENNNATDEPMAVGTQIPADEVAIEVTPQPILTTEASTQPKTEEASSSSDTTVTDLASTTLPADSATATPAATPLPLVPEHAPWEISILGGAFSSTTHYSGANRAEWNADISKENSIGIGAELMHMGRNFGIGTGLHYSIYSEGFKTAAFDRHITTLENFWYLMTVDTIVLVITDTIPGTPPTYTGTSQTTTVNVLTQGTDTMTSTERLREARDQVNRVSYLEVPLLLDAHLVQGRWSFGLRGGPTAGLLSGRRGSLPSSDNEGYVSLSDQPFRELTLGYTARAYVRYRFNAAWSVGIEPAMRGQLMNSLGTGDLSRRASAQGVMLSLSYRLR